jgi:DNA-directed RNA polymerase specialized sigma24 family protein
MNGGYKGEGEELTDEAAGPLVPAFIVTRGRTHPSDTVDLVALVTPADSVASAAGGLGPEHRAILRLCQELPLPLSVAELSAHLHLPLGAVRVLLSDLHAQRLVHISAPVPDAPDETLLKAVLAGLRQL